MKEFLEVMTEPRYKIIVDGKGYTTEEVCIQYCCEETNHNLALCMNINKTPGMFDRCERPNIFNDPTVENLLRP